MYGKKREVQNATVENTHGKWFRSNKDGNERSIYRVGRFFSSYISLVSHDDRALSSDGLFNFLYQLFRYRS